MRMGHFFPYLAVALSVFGGYQAQAQDGGKEITVDYSNPKQYVVGGISVEGNKYINSDQILKISGLQPGFEVTVPGEEFSAVVDRLWLQKYFEDVTMVIDSISQVRRAERTPGTSESQEGRGVFRLCRQDLYRHHKALLQGKRLSPD